MEKSLKSLNDWVENLIKGFEADKKEGEHMNWMDDSGAKACLDLWSDCSAKWDREVKKTLNKLNLTIHELWSHASPEECGESGIVEVQLWHTHFHTICDELFPDCEQLKTRTGNLNPHVKVWLQLWLKEALQTAHKLRDHMLKTLTTTESSIESLLGPQFWTKLISHVHWPSTEVAANFGHPEATIHAFYIPLTGIWLKSGTMHWNGGKHVESPWDSATPPMACYLAPAVPPNTAMVNGNKYHLMSHFDETFAHPITLWIPYPCLTLAYSYQSLTQTKYETNLVALEMKKITILNHLLSKWMSQPAWTVRKSDQDSSNQNELGEAATKEETATHWAGLSEETQKLEWASIIHSLWEPAEANPKVEQWRKQTFLEGRDLGVEEEQKLNPQQLAEMLGWKHKASIPAAF
ncbi:hypothetical protein C8J57DRAFT_1240631 [Mycena rebaudengoi]|nr:hypothetical protein C8J57DRAFT_1240631 [Mycena rebaudengoi]